MGGGLGNSLSTLILSTLAAAGGFFIGLLVYQFLVNNMIIQPIGRRSLDQAEQTARYDILRDVIDGIDEFGKKLEFLQTDDYKE